MNRMPLADAPIGVFDSGVGGLTVLRALREHLPGESLLYLGDTARLPYGSKSAGTVVRYAEQCARVLVARGVKLLVIACKADPDLKTIKGVSARNVARGEVAEWMAKNCK